MPGPLVEAGDVLAVTYDSLYLNQQILTTLHYRLRGANALIPSLTDCYNSMRSRLDELAGLSDAYAQLFTTNVTDIKLRIQKIHPLRYVQQTQYANPSSGTRTAPGNALPPNLAASVTLKTFLAGRHERGSKHILITLPADMENGIIQSEFRGLLESWATLAVQPLDLEGQLEGFTADPVVFNRDNIGASKVVETYQIETTSRVMRRRTVGHGS